MSTLRKLDYLEEAVKPFSPRTALEEAARCLLCHDAPCSEACPAKTDPAKFIRSVRFRNVKGAAETIREANVLGGVCARVCPYDKLCEEACSRTGIDRPIEIGRLQSFITDQEKLFGMEILQKGPAKGKKVACVGAGPASLACAARLAVEGYGVTVYEAREKAGGVLSYGIIPARLPQDVVDQEVGYVKKLGVQFKFNTKVGKDVSLSDLQKQYDAVFIGAGLWTPKMPDIPGLELDGVTNAVDFLAAAKSSCGKTAIGKNVVVIGGGDVAMDCASTAKLLGAKTTIVYRRTLEEAPANTAEVEFVQSLGVGFCLQFRPAEVVGKDGKVTAFKAEGADGESQLTLKADQVVFAIGQEPEDFKALGNFSLNEKNLIKVKDAGNFSTGVDGVFAAGDAVNGGKTVVQAVADGKAAGDNIISYLAGKGGA